ncbi:MAG: hypothetical protein DWQ04_01260 [Chloroflexi bacterium]|nr:MAG: hypothetical protein DWQ04_01260 [Chloroflexota bacterium]
MTIFGMLTGIFLVIFLKSCHGLIVSAFPTKPSGSMVTQQSLENYLLNEYGETAECLLMEARKDVNKWRERVSTQIGLEIWADETYNMLSIPPRYE